MKHLDDTLVKVCLVASYVAIAIDCMGLFFLSWEREILEEKG